MRVQVPSRPATGPESFVGNWYLYRAFQMIQVVKGCGVSKVKLIGQVSQMIGGITSMSTTIRPPVRKPIVSDNEFTTKVGDVNYDGWHITIHCNDYGSSLGPAATSVLILEQACILWVCRRCIEDRCQSNCIVGTSHVHHRRTTTDGDQFDVSDA